MSDDTPAAASQRLQQLQLRIVMGRADVLDIPRREECTICTVVAPNAVFTRADRRHRSLYCLD